jgi:hypothetical protein
LRNDKIKVLAFKPEYLSRRRHGDEGISADTKPGINTTGEVRDAQRNLLACGFTTKDAQIGPGSRGYFVIEDVMDDVLEMITPNTAYVTGPPSLGQIKETFNGSGLSKRQRDDYWKGQRGGHST